MPMKLLFVADGRSPIALNWISGFIEQGDAVHLVSTYPCHPDLTLASLELLPVAFSGMKKAREYRGQTGEKRSRVSRGGSIQLRTGFRHWFGPLTIPPAARKLQAHIRKIQPDIVHALRIPYEGMLAAAALGQNPEIPLIISVWGNDFTLHAPTTPWTRAYTRRALGRVNGLHTDCQRDLHLARQWGFSSQKPTVVLPGNGGIRLDIFYPGELNKYSEELVINPRGFRAYVRNDVFFKAVPMVLAAHPGVRFICPAMEGEPQAEGWLQAYPISNAVDLLPVLSMNGMAEQFRRAQVAVSPSTHDGTPNTLLEAMACGCFPIAGDIESLREWITPGLNGLLVDPNEPRAVSEAILIALRSPDLRRQAAEHNRQLVIERAEFHQVMRDARKFYQIFLEK